MRASILRTTNVADGSFHNDDLPASLPQEVSDQNETAHADQFHNACKLGTPIDLPIGTRLAAGATIASDRPVEWNKKRRGADRMLTFIRHARTDPVLRQMNDSNVAFGEIEAVLAEMVPYHVNDVWEYRLGINADTADILFGDLWPPRNAADEKPLDTAAELARLHPVPLPDCLSTGKSATQKLLSLCIWLRHLNPGHSVILSEPDAERLTGTTAGHIWRLMRTFRDKGLLRQTHTGKPGIKSKDAGEYRILDAKLLAFPDRALTTPHRRAA